jgi:hypothetical protein
MKFRAIWLVIRPSKADLSVSVLPIAAFFIIGSIVFTVAALARLFWNVPASDFGEYRILAVALLAVLLVPVATLGSAAARLSVRRRDDRLATLRLLGASAGWVRAIAIVETSLLATVGLLCSVIGYLLLTPLLAFVPVAGSQSPLGTIWLPPWWLVCLGVSLVLVAVISVASGLRDVMISPLGVRARTNAPKLHWLRLAISAAVVALGIVVLQFTSVSWGAIGITVALLGVLVAIMAVQNVAGPFVVGFFARRQAATAQNAAELIAARGLLESPKAAWRQVSGVALASFVVVPAGSILGFLNTVQNGPTALSSQQLLFFGDIRTVVLTAVAISFLLVACSVGITQSAAIMERRDLYVGLDRLGMPMSVMEASRRRAVMMPLKIAAIGSSVLASILVIPVVAISLFTAPLFIVSVILCVIGGVWIVRLGVAATHPVLRGVLADPDQSL